MVCSHSNRVLYVFYLVLLIFYYSTAAKYVYKIIIALYIDHLHANPKEFIIKLIAVMSWLDAVVAYTNVLYPMEN